VFTIQAVQDVAAKGPDRHYSLNCGSSPPAWVSFPTGSVGCVIFGFYAASLRVGHICALGCTVPVKVLLGLVVLFLRASRRRELLEAHNCLGEFQGMLAWMWSSNHQVFMAIRNSRSIQSPALHLLLGFYFYIFFLKLFFFSSWKTCAAWWRAAFNRGMSVIYCLNLCYGWRDCIMALFLLAVFSNVLFV